MANLAKALKEEIDRLAKKQARSYTALLKKQSAQYRRDIASLKREVATVQRRLNHVEKKARKVAKAPAAKSAVLEGVRFSAKGLKSHRTKLGLSAADYAKLLDCSALSVYKWESGETRPRVAQIARIAEIRGLGVRDAMRQLEKIG